MSFLKWGKIDVECCDCIDELPLFGSNRLIIAAIFELVVNEVKMRKSHEKLES